MTISQYYEPDRVQRMIDSGKHREIIGGMWDEMGLLQINYLKAKGLAPSHRIVDVGCGSLRAGVELVRYLDAGNYHGMDVNENLIEAGIERELVPAGLADKAPRSNFHVSENFDFSWVNEPFDFALAQSLFSHLPYNHLKLALANLKPAMAPGGRFYATFFMVSDDHPADASFLHPKGIRSLPAHNPFHFCRSEVELAAQLTGWGLADIEPWQHPRDQMMACFISN